ncbi:MAG: hypothetical protein LWX02_02170 [Deltaproteobacteria bacterium]|jgi:hypothetical protein|nr:hypothetical protein [Deltaproteobacteria bacterium]MDL1986977.1 hypothetical protein [Deltaproteobacteria bacterium]
MEDHRIIITSQIDGDFEGFDDEVLFKFMDGTYWIQDEYKYWYHYSYCPVAEILEVGGRLYIRVHNQNKIVPVRQIQNVIESKINGEFKGWEGETEYELTNGQVWKQATYKYQYKYAYMPSATVYETYSGMVMAVKGTRAKVRRVR